MRYLVRTILVGVLLSSPFAFATPLSVTINTTSLAGSNGQVVFDFIDGGDPSNFATVSNLQVIGGTLGSAVFVGDAAGSATAFKLGDAQFFNEASFSLSAGSSISFLFNTTTNAPTDSSIPDALSIFLLNPQGNSFFTTIDPSGTNALLLQNADGSSPSIYSPSVSVPISATPEPSSFVLLFSGLIALLFVGLRRSRISVHKDGLALLVAVLLSASSSDAQSAQTDVTALVKTSASGLTLDRSTGSFNSTVVVTNTSGVTILPPVSIAVSGLPNSVSLANGIGTALNGSPFVSASAQALNPGQATPYVLLKFNNPQRVKFNAVFHTFGIVSASLPPDPGAAGLTTLEGVDSNGNGLRDDLERFIALTYPQSLKTQKALAAMAMTFQATLLSANANNRDLTVNLANRTARDSECLYYIRPQDALLVESKLLAQITNTKLRSVVWIKANSLVGGTTFTSRKIPQWKTSCNNFNPDALPN